MLPAGRQRRPSRPRRDILVLKAKSVFERKLIIAYVKRTGYAVHDTFSLQFSTVLQGQASTTTNTWCVMFVVWCPRRVHREGVPGMEPAMFHCFVIFVCSKIVSASSLSLYGLVGNMRSQSPPWNSTAANDLTMIYSLL